ncbi:hypothetical protein [Haloarcula marina]|uniref:hypothetical protein n=1 Tax=Haloarcula marina TaxID=2961574 RepID=UPI0020B6E967|nr:hypothetical protein [Halomicroarcula marina]
MGRASMVAWALLVSFWAGMVGGAAVAQPALEYIQLYTVGFAAVAFPLAYWTISTHPDVFASAHRPGRVGLFIVTIFVVTVVLATLFEFLLGYTSPLGIAAQLLAYVAGLGTALYLAYGGGFDYLWDEYT